MSALRRDISLRLCGLLLCGLAGLALRSLAQMPPVATGADPGLSRLALAGVVFLGTSFGLILIGLGRHLLDPLDVSPRWQRCAKASPLTPRQQQDEASPRLAA